jgi:RHH-type proline utilization regulon transcriptional repressor/proline dehydrogenase/delta 1-pyrroline-5-carboxylate dehydrogenase
MASVAMHDALPASDGDELANEAVSLAADLLAEAAKTETKQERARAAELARLMSDPRGRALTIAMSDQVFRSARHSRVASQLTWLIEKYGIPHYLSPLERFAMYLASALGPYLPNLIVPAVIAHLRRKTRAVILAGEEHALHAHLERRHSEGIRLNLNQLGEAILGEEEARVRLDAYIKLLQRPDVDYISVKISSVLSQINLLDYDNSVAQIQDRLRVLYRTAANRPLPAFVNLDMEEYRDLHITIAAFRATLEEEEFKSFHAGIVLQAYLPDAHRHQKYITVWAQQRVAAGGAPVKLRIVKGANLAMEKVDASIHGWQEATFHTKAEVDANYKRMVAYALQPQNARAVHVGIASHNLFDVAWALLLRAKNGVTKFAEIEMLEGMANPQARAVKKVAGSILLYAPVVKSEDFRSAISYLLRRLDENAADGNFLHDLFGLTPGGHRWQHQKEAFLTAVRSRNRLADAPNRDQNRNTQQRTFDPSLPFHNEPDTDWSLPHNQTWIRPYVERWRDADVRPIPLQINGGLLNPNLNGKGEDPSTPGRDSYRYALATPAEIESALITAVNAQEQWAATTVEHRARLLNRVAEVLAERRGDLIGVMMRDTGKSVSEGDPEVSEAIDFATYYARSFNAIKTEHEPLGTILVTPPWNFPLAIPASGVLAALMAGNTVILKPAPESVLTGWHLCAALWDAGIPGPVLQFVPTSDDHVGQSLVTDPRIRAVILTGSYETARLFKSWKPDLHLIAETSGKNSIVITALSDRDQAIKDLIRSAFGHAGQKCSAASLAVLEAEVYDSPAFLNRLRDAAASLPVGEAWNLASAVTPVIREPGEALHRALTQLNEGEQWLLKPQIVNGNPQLWSPGIKLAIKRGSWFHRTECFGPVLGVMRAENLTDAIAIVNESDFGLTSGLHSLDDREIALWTDNIEAGNLYVNRGITGAIVQRQPFGGWKKSVFGAAKAGGPNYVLNLCHWKSGSTTYEQAWKDHFSQDHDPSRILGESNIFRYRPIRNVLIRLTKEDNPDDGTCALKAAKVCGVPATLCNDEKEFIERIPAFERVRAFRPLTRQQYEKANAAHTLVIETPLTNDGRIELRHYLREQSVTRTTHRYGAIQAGT